MKRLDAILAHCSDCPFQTVIETVIKVNGADMEQGWFCTHKARRDYIVKLDVVEEDGCVTLGEWLTYKHNAMFPPDCPLPDVKVGKARTGKRSLNI